MSSASPVWLNGERFDVAYLLTPGGRAVRRFDMKKVRVGNTGGMGQRVGRKFVGVFVHPESKEVILRVGHREVTLDGSVNIHHETKLGGVISQMVVRPSDGGEIVVSDLTPARAILRKFDPGYDDLEESMDDFLADVADIAASEERRRWILQTTDPSSGPWHLLDTE